MFSCHDAEARFPALMKALRASKAAGRMAHAYLVHGDDPRLREGFSVLLAQLAACGVGAPPSQPCGSCGSCAKLASGAYPDLHILRPASKSREIRVGDDSDEPDTLRWFQARFSLTSMSGNDKKIGIIHDADCMNVFAQNAFLKTLEEPPRDSLFILSTGSPNALLPTIRSRCQTLLVLSNRTVYELPGLPELLGVLGMLTSPYEPKGIVLVDSCASRLVRVSKSLTDAAEETVKTRLASRIEDRKQAETEVVRKRIDRQIEAAVKAEYLRMREYYLSVIHTWFSQLYQLACGIDRQLLGNPELLPEDVAPLIGDERVALDNLKKAERLVNYLSWYNLDEELAIYEFCAGILLSSKRSPV